MKIYFIRHGESEANKHKTEQGAKGQLSEQGRRQAEYVAKRLDGTPVDMIISSTFDRARETTEIINTTLNQKVVYSKLFGERMPPTSIIDKKLNDPEVIKVNKTIEENFQKKAGNWRYEDEENFVDLKTRALKALEYLQKQKKDKILVVTHGGFLRMIISLMMFGESLKCHEYINILYTFKTSNTGVTLCEYPNVGSQKGKWKIIAWNDHAHLGSRVKKVKFRSSHFTKISPNYTNITWRFFDEKNLQKGDELILVNSDTDREAGRGIVLEVFEKRLGLVDRVDFPTHEVYHTRDKLYETYRGYYGDIVTLDTLVKIVKFKLANS